MSTKYFTKIPKPIEDTDEKLENSQSEVILKS
jgi:hypothetical protein